jgi:hypothetical protein
MNNKPTHPPRYTPERIKELVERMATLRQRWLISVKSRTPAATEKERGRLSDRLAKVKDWPKHHRD